MTYIEIIFPETERLELEVKYQGEETSQNMNFVTSHFGKMNL